MLLSLTVNGPLGNLTAMSDQYHPYYGPWPYVVLEYADAALVARHTVEMAGTRFAFSPQKSIQTLRSRMQKRLADTKRGEPRRRFEVHVLATAGADVLSPPTTDLRHASHQAFYAHIGYDPLNDFRLNFVDRHAC